MSYYFDAIFTKDDETDKAVIEHDPEDSGSEIIGINVQNHEGGTPTTVWLSRDEAIEAANAILNALGWKPEAEAATLEARPIGGDVSEAIDRLGDRLVEAIRSEQQTVSIASTFVAPPLPEAETLRDFSSPLAAQESEDPDGWNRDALDYASDYGLWATFLYRSEDDAFPHQRVVKVEGTDAQHVYGYDTEDENRYKTYRFDRIYGYALVLAEEPSVA